MKKLDERYHVDADTGFRLRYVKSETENFKPHSHNYYEIFLTLTDNITHFVNGTNQILSRGNLLFIRDFDEHEYSSADGGRFEFLNLAISKKTMLELFEYLGDEQTEKKLITSPLPPNAVLTSRDTEKLFYDLFLIGDSKTPSEFKARMRALLSSIFIKYFYLTNHESSDIPLWLEMACEKMKNPKNFIQGTSRLFELAGKSREHTSREIKRCYGATVTDFVNELRLNYAANLIKQSNLTMTDICYESGFLNLSWFYKLFKNKYGKSPADYRKEK